ncbi:MAG: M24 family metallopeptidase [Phycisphaeraceae bacterium]|nr:MAG: M24 family metallopeptidase [Phycisphaeraceae bacterium]
MNPRPTILAGVPATNATLYHALRFSVGDPCALLTVPGRPGGERVLIIRDIEMARAARHARADAVSCPADWAPAPGLSADRETATAQAAAECLRRSGVPRVRSDRTLPLSFVHELRLAGIEIDYDPDLGVTDRRVKDADEIKALRAAQADTERSVELACRAIARATAGPGGVLLHEGTPLTSERVRAMIDAFLTERGYANPTSIVAAGPHGGDCHEYGRGEITTGQPVIVDIFPAHKASRYHGDSTRTVVHGTPTPQIARMHAAVVEAKNAASAAARAGNSGHDVHAQTLRVLASHGYARALPKDTDPPEFTSLQHGTGHGIGLDGHEPPLLDDRGPTLLDGDVVTIEPGLYSKAFGGVRVEDMVHVTRDGPIDLGTGLHQGLDWK